MAKVLACPSCGRKHPLDLLVGLDSFVCNGCNKTLAVPSEVNRLSNEISSTKIVNKDIEDSQLQVIAHSSLNQSQQNEMQNTVAAEPVSPQSEIFEPIKKNEEIPQEAKNPKENPKLNIPLGIFSSLFIWAASIVAGFIIVVIMPRFIGYGFHASDFLGVITNQGISRYKIVMALIFLWSIASVASVYALSFVYKRLFLFKKLAK